MSAGGDRYRARLKARDPEDYRRRRRDEQRRYRERKYAKGLTSTGSVVTRQDIADVRRVYGPHPTDCLCHDCLFPPAPYEPTVYRAGVKS